MKAIISNRIYMDNPGNAATKFISNQLTYKIPKNTGSKKFSTVETIKNYKLFNWFKLTITILSSARRIGYHFLNLLLYTQTIL